MLDPFNDPLIQVKIGLYRDNNFVTIKPLVHKGIRIPSGFVFDGVTVRAPFTFIFSNKDLRKGIIASCFHDWMCRRKETYKRKEATKVLIDLWKKEGLPTWKCWIVYLFVEIYQICKGWK